MFTRIACLLAAVPLLAVAARADDKKEPTDLQGAWRLTSVESEGGSPALTDPRPELAIKGDRLLYGGEEIARVSADAATQPKILDLRFANPERVYEGVYAVEADSLKVCLNGRSEGVKERPQSFSLEGHPDWRLLTFERVKEGQAKAAGGFVGMALRGDDKRGEVVVGATLDGSPARKADVRPDDVLLAVGGGPVTDLRSAVAAVRQVKPHSDLILRIRRAGEERDVTVKVAVFPFTLLAGLE